MSPPHHTDGTARPTTDPAPRAAGSRASAARPRRAATAARDVVPPILVRQIRNGITESDHRGHVVEVDAEGRIIRLAGDPDRLVTLRSCVKPFGVVALIEAGGMEAFDLSPTEIALMASSHSGEDLHVRTLQALFRRAGVSQTLLACGTEGMPLDALTAARLARDGERPSPIRHMCSGQHSVLLLLSRLRGWPLETYWHEDHPAHVAYREAVARSFGAPADKLVTALDGCGLLTYAFPLREVARAFAMLAQPDALPAKDPRRSLASALTMVRDGMLAHPDLVAGTRDRIDTSVMKALPARVISKAGMEALRGVAILAGPRSNGGPTGPTGMAIKIEDGGGFDRAPWAAVIEALVQVGLLEGQALRVLARYHRPVSLDPHGRTAATAIPSFDLAPVHELLG